MRPPTPIAAIALTGALAASALIPPATAAAEETSVTGPAVSTNATGSVQTPTVEGPIPSDPDSADRTFFGTDLDIARRGFVEEEFFFGGDANVYDATIAGGIGARPTASPTAEIVSEDHDYKTRMVVRRPEDPRQFNGKVVVEWLNATSGYDVEALWFRTHEFFLREGYAWVGITAQSAPIEHEELGLKTFNPTRYGSLDLTDDGSLTTGDPLSYDAYAEGVQAVRHTDVLGPLSDDVETVLGAGVSQSAGRLSVFANAIQPRHESVLDGLLLYIGGERVREDLDIPVVKLLSETEFTAPYAPDVRGSLQPDTDGMRTWTMAGTSHSDWASFAGRYALMRRDQPTASLQDTCARPSRSRIPDRYVISSALDQLGDWAQGGDGPVSAPPLTLTESGDVVRDEHGNALGGIRLAPFAVPTALSSGANETRPGAEGLCFLNGTHLPFDTETLDQLYPDRHSYVSAFDTAARDNVADGFVLPEDAAEMRADARASLLGTGLVCEALCANVDQFPANPSTQLLRDHTAFLYLHGGGPLLHLIDRATESVARAQTDPGMAERHRGRAVRALESYRSRVIRLTDQGRVTEDQADLLTEYARILVDRLS